MVNWWLVDLICGLPIGGILAVAVGYVTVSAKIPRKLKELS